MRNLRRQMDVLHQHGWLDGALGKRPDPTRFDNQCGDVRFLRWAYEAGYATGATERQGVIDRAKARS